MRNWFLRILIVLLAVSAGGAYYLFDTSHETITFVSPAAGLADEVSTTVPIAVATTTTAIPTTTASVVPETTTTAAVASTVPVTVPDPGEVACAARYTDWVYMPTLDALCRPVDYVERIPDEDFTPTDDHVSIDGAQSLPGETDKGKLSYLAGHINQRNGENVFERLPELQVGAPVVTMVRGVRHVFVVTGHEFWSKGETRTEGGAIISSENFEPETWFVTCGGDLVDGSYTHNLIARTRLVV